MTSAVFDTLAAAEALEAAGMDPRQAKACATQMQAAAGATRHELATKTDLQAEIAALEARLVMWVVGIQLAGAALILSGVAALKLL